MESLALRCMKSLTSKKSHGSQSRCTFAVRYLGSGQLTRPGLEEMCTFVHTTFEERKSKLKQLRKGSLVTSMEDFVITSCQNGLDSPLVFKIRRIQFCGVYKINPKIFFFTYQFGKSADTVDIHVVMCKSNKEAKTLAKEAAVLFRDVTFSLHKEH